MVSALDSGSSGAVLGQHNSQNSQFSPYYLSKFCGYICAYFWLHQQ